MSEIDLHENLRLFLIVGIALTGGGTLVFAYRQTSAARSAISSYGRAILLCGIALCGLLTFELFQTESKVIDRQAHAITLLQNTLWLAQQRAKGSLTENDLLILSTAIKPFAGTEYDLMAARCADEVLVNELSAALSEGQWTSVRTHKTTEAVASNARSVRIQYSGASDLKTAANSLMSAFAAMGLDVTVETDSVDVKPNIVYISVGPSSQ